MVYDPSKMHFLRSGLHHRGSLFFRFSSSGWPLTRVCQYSKRFKWWNGRLGLRYWRNAALQLALLCGTWLRVMITFFVIYWIFSFITYAFGYSGLFIIQNDNVEWFFLKSIWLIILNSCCFWVISAFALPQLVSFSLLKLAYLGNTYMTWGKIAFTIKSRQYQLYSSNNQESCSDHVIRYNWRV